MQKSLAIATEPVKMQTTFEYEKIPFQLAQFPRKLSENSKLSSHKKLAKNPNKRIKIAGFPSTCLCSLNKSTDKKNLSI